MLIAAIAASVLTAFAQPTAEELAALCESARADAGSPAMGLVVATADAEPAIAVAGVRITDTDNAAMPDDLWHWGSITKSMTATLVARLAERGTVSWDDTIADHLAGRVGTIHETYQQTTFAHLLSHRAGLQPNIPMDQFGTFHRPVEDPIADRLEWVSIALAQEPAADLAEKNIYSNNGYIVAAAMLEAATGEPWEILIQREVFAPLGIEHAGFGDPAATRPQAHPRGHRFNDQHTAVMPAGADNPPALGPAGRVHMPLADIARYLHAHAHRPEHFLSEASFDRLHTPRLRRLLRLRVDHVTHRPTLAQRLEHHVVRRGRVRPKNRHRRRGRRQHRQHPGRQARRLQGTPGPPRRGRLRPHRPN